MVTSGVDITDKLTALDAMAWRVLRNTTLRALLKPSGRTPLDVTLERAEAMLEPYTAALQSDCAQLREAFKQSFLMGVEHLQTALHGQPGVDDEMLDEAVEFHLNPQDTDAEALEP